MMGLRVGTAEFVHSQHQPLAEAMDCWQWQFLAHPRKGVVALRFGFEVYSY